MSSPENLFTRFKAAITSYSLPERFTYPFYYQPHPLCELAMQELQQHLATQINWQHNFGLEGDTDSANGKMFGVLVVKNSDGELGYLSAFSGKLADSNHLPGFVPPVFDMLAKDSFFLVGQQQLNQLTRQLKPLEANPEIAVLQQQLAAEQTTCDQKIALHRATMIEQRKVRKQQRIAGQNNLNDAEFELLKNELAQQSIQLKNELRDLTAHWQQQVEQATLKLQQLTDVIDDIKQQRKSLSVDLQQQLFASYQFLNSSGEQRNLAELFLNTAQLTPPAGAGECAAPKLLHYAFQHGLTPVALAEFWWGISPKSQIRQHKNIYGACLGKCQPILEHMLQGIQLDDNPLLTNPAAGKTIDIVYQDEQMVIINKPAEFLSVPGKNINDSIYVRMQQAFPDAKGPLIVHRLDMSTSGLMVIALTKQAHQNLQKQFINRTVEKRYVALLDGELNEQQGMIRLPLRVDLDDRPRQLVCYEYGRIAETRWQLISTDNKQSKVYFYPKTGRTHQLRVHAAHINGLNTAIVGDDLYGSKANRLHLHAESLTLDQPVTKQRLHFQLDADF
ncbi:RNA pseudouridine synthase [Methylophaga sp. 41_12_T18]|nr:RNA pseudouridine synthase [Methylophaga sp. 41_12_T18]